MWVLLLPYDTGPSLKSPLPLPSPSTVLCFLHFWLSFTLSACSFILGSLMLPAVGATLCRGAQLSHCSGLLRCGAQVPGAQASAVVASGLQSVGSAVMAHGLQLLHVMWNLPRPGIKPVSPALAGGLLSTASLRKSPWSSFISLLCAFFLF